MRLGSDLLRMVSDRYDGRKNARGASLGGAWWWNRYVAWPGLGRLAFEELSARDTKPALSDRRFSGLDRDVTVTAGRLLTGWLDPRTRKFDEAHQRLWKRVSAQLLAAPTQVSSPLAIDA